MRIQKYNINEENKYYSLQINIEGLDDLLFCRELINLGKKHTNSLSFNCNMFLKELEKNLQIIKK